MIWPKWIIVCMYVVLFFKVSKSFALFPKTRWISVWADSIKSLVRCYCSVLLRLKKRPLTVIITVALYMGSKTLYSGQFCLYYLILGFDHSACWNINCQKCNSFHIQNGAFCLKKKDLKVFCTTFLKSDTNTVHLKIKVLGRERKNM